MGVSKTCLVTGATSGIGLGIARGLAKQNVRLILVARNTQKGEETKKDLIAFSGNQQIFFYTADLSSQADIRELARKIREAHPVIDVLINNAGIWLSKQEWTVDKIEKQFAVNHLAYFLLTHLLYKNIAASGDGRIINMGSDAHKYGKMHFENLNLEGVYHGLRAHGQTKLANLLFTYELHRAKQDAHVSVYCIQPGLVKTDIGVKHTNALHRLLWKIRRSGGITPDEAAKTAVFLAFDPEVKQRSGLYWDNCKPKPSSKSSYREEDARRLWTESLRLCNIQDYFNDLYTP